MQNLGTKSESVRIVPIRLCILSLKGYNSRCYSGQRHRLRHEQREQKGVYIEHLPIKLAKLAKIGKIKKLAKIGKTKLLRTAETM